MSDHKSVVSPLLGIANSLAIIVVIVIAVGAYRSQNSAMAGLQRSVDAISQRLASQPAAEAAPSQRPSSAGQDGMIERSYRAQSAGGQQSAGAGEVRAAGSASQQASGLEAAYARDARDVNGALVETRLDAVARQPELLSSGVAPEVVHTDCRARSCRIVAQFKNAGSAEDWPLLYATSAAATLSGTRTVTLPQADGSVEVRIFGTRR